MVKFVSHSNANSHGIIDRYTTITYRVSAGKVDTYELAIKSNQDFIKHFSKTRAGNGNMGHGE